MPIATCIISKNMINDAGVYRSFRLSRIQILLHPSPKYGRGEGVRFRLYSIQVKTRAKLTNPIHIDSIYASL